MKLNYHRREISDLVFVTLFIARDSTMHSITLDVRSISSASRTHAAIVV